METNPTGLTTFRPISRVGCGRASPTTVRRHDRFTEVPCGCGMSKVLSDNDDEGVLRDEEEQAAVQKTCRAGCYCCHWLSVVGIGYSAQTA